MRKPKGIVVTDATVDVDLGGNGEVDIVLYSHKEKRGIRVKIHVRDGYLMIEPGDGFAYCDDTPLTFISASLQRKHTDQEMYQAMEELMGHPNLLLADDPAYDDIKYLVR